VLSGKYQDDAWPAGAPFTGYKQGGRSTESMTTRFLNPKTRATTAQVIKLAAERSMSPVSFAVAWTLSRDFVGSTIVGATRADQLPELLLGAESKLDQPALEAVDRLTREILYPMG
jgi:aryl-alcohol dehydrogenase-like predicted oxidoreductase